MPFHHRNRRRSRRLHRPHLLLRTLEALLPSDSSSSPLCQGIVCHRRSIASSSSMSPERPQWPLRSTRRTPAAAAAAVNAKDDGAEPRLIRNGVVGSAAAARVVPLRGDGAVLPGSATDDALVVEAVVAEEDLSRGLHGGAADDGDAALRLEEAVLLPQVRKLAQFQCALLVHAVTGS